MGYYSYKRRWEQLENIRKKTRWIFAAIECECRKVIRPAEYDSTNGQTTQAEFDKIIEEAKSKWLGKQSIEQ